MTSRDSSLSGLSDLRGEPLPEPRELRPSLRDGALRPRVLVAGQGPPIVIIGAGDAGVRVLRLLKDREPSAGRVVAFLDEDPERQGSRIQGIPVFGFRSRLPEILRAHHGCEVLVAINDPPGELLQYIRACCEPVGVTWKVVTASVSVT